MSFLSTIVISAFEKELAAEAPEIQAYILKVLGTLGSELMAYVTQKVVAANPPAQVAPVAEQNPTS